MATKTQRAQSLVDALTNRATPAAQVSQMADAFCRLRQMDPSTMTLAQKADVLISEMRAFGLRSLKRAEGDTAAAAAVSANNATIDANFAEAP